MTEFETVMQTRDEVEGLHNAPINVMPAGGGRQGMGWGFDFFQKFAIKFPAHGQIIPVQMQPNFPTPGYILLSIPRQNVRKAQ